MAQIHEASLAALNVSPGKKGLTKRAQRFFNEAIIPILATHRAAGKSRIALNPMNKLPGRFTGDVAVTKRQLKQGNVQRATAAGLKTAAEDQARLLKESLAFCRTACGG